MLVLGWNMFQPDRNREDTEIGLFWQGENTLQSENWPKTLQAIRVSAEDQLECSSNFLHILTSEVRQDNQRLSLGLKDEMHYRGTKA